MLGILAWSCCLPAGAQEQAEAYPLRQIPLQVVFLSDNDGGRQTSVGPAKMRRWVECANRAFSDARIQFSYQGTPEDTVKVADTSLNGSFFGQVFVPFKCKKEELIACNRLAARYPGKLTVLVRWGPQPEPTMFSCASHDWNFIIRSPGEPIDVLAHEIGHYFGLPHTFGESFPTIEDAAKYLRQKKNDPQVFDGDGFSDTPPDPAIRPLLSRREARRLLGGNPAEVQLNGIAFELPRHNLMSYYDGVRDSLSPQQIERVRWILDKRLERQMAMPSNQGEVHSPIEAEALPVVTARDVTTWVQPMAGFGVSGWSKDKQLLCNGREGGGIGFAFDSPRNGEYTLNVYLTMSWDYAKVVLSVDDSQFKKTVDLYAPVVLPTGRISMPVGYLTPGRHILHCRVADRNPRSTGDLFGIDCIEIQRDGKP